jgi:hypothetical protein
MIAPPPARCPSCDALVSMTLVADPETPIYKCGSTPYRIVCRPVVSLPTFTSLHNLAPPTDADLAGLDHVVGAYLSARIVRPVMGLCDYIVDYHDDAPIRCGATGVDGRCLIHA